MNSGWVAVTKAPCVCHEVAPSDWPMPSSPVGPMSSTPWYRGPWNMIFFSNISSAVYVVGRELVSARGSWRGASGYVPKRTLSRQ